MWQFIFNCIFISNYLISSTYSQGLSLKDLNLKFYFHPDLHLDFKQMVNKYGYPFERHEVTTEDGYILTVFRLPHGRNTTKVNPHPLFIAHGTAGSADLMVTIKPYGALAYYLADRGFDVWIINHRGSYHSQKHKIFGNEINSDFWNFGWHEIGVYDYPVTIDYILNKTGKEQLFYIGHSQGTTSYFPMTIEKPEYNKKIRFAMHLAPTLFVWHRRMPVVRAITKFTNVLYYGSYLLGMRKLFPLNDILLPIVRFASSEMTVISEIFRQLINFGPWTAALDKKILQLAFKTCPYGVSMGTIAHYGQVAHSGKVAYFDYGPQENLKLYGKEEPPLYNFSLSTAPFGLFYSPKDFLTPDAQISDFKRLFPKNLKYIRKIDANENYTHIDFVLGHNADEVIYKHVVDVFHKIINNEIVL